jgi:hypothetical protein
MSTIDSFEFIVNSIARDLKDVNDTLALLGLYYTSKLVLTTLVKSLSYTKTYLIPYLFSNEKWIKSLGDWAIIAGCTDQIGKGYAEELANRGINLILIDQDQALVENLANNLSKLNS